MPLTREEVELTLAGKCALVTGGSRGIGRGIALKLAAQGARVAVHYYQNEMAAHDTLTKIRECGGDGFVVQADVSLPDELGQLFQRVEREFGKLDVFVANARPELATFYEAPLTICLEKWDMAMDSQGKAFLVGVQEATRLMDDGGRIVAITYAPSVQTGSWQPWVAMGAAKAALEALAATSRSRSVPVASRSTPSAPG